MTPWSAPRRPNYGTWLEALGSALLCVVGFGLLTVLCALLG